MSASAGFEIVWIPKRPSVDSLQEDQNKYQAMKRLAYRFSGENAKDGVEDEAVVTIAAGRAVREFVALLPLVVPAASGFPGSTLDLALLFFLDEWKITA